LLRVVMIVLHQENKRATSWPNVEGMFQTGRTKSRWFCDKRRVVISAPCDHLGMWKLCLNLRTDDHVLKMGHDTFGGHMSVKRTKARISFLLGKFEWRLWWLYQDLCQLKAPVTCVIVYRLHRYLVLIVYLIICLLIAWTFDVRWRPVGQIQLCVHRC